MIVVSTGCPCSVGPEVSLLAAARVRGVARVLVGDVPTLLRAAELVGIPRAKLRQMGEGRTRGSGIYLLPAGPSLTDRDRVPGRPTATSGAAQLAYVETAYRLAHRYRVPLVTAAVSKAAIAASGGREAARFRGHTEWLCRLDAARDVTMCFLAPRIATALVTTHLPLRRVARAITPEAVARTTEHLVQLLIAAGQVNPNVAVASLNPHAGESELLGEEESRAIVPGIQRARRKLSQQATLDGPIGAETAFRLAAGSKYHGVVAMYHDQATVPMKLLAFGEAVNVTMGLSIVRTSVDHGTAYDIAWQGKADPSGMHSAMQLARRLTTEGAASAVVASPR